MTNPGYIIERKWFCPRWLFWRLKGFWSFWMVRTEIKHDRRIFDFLRGDADGSPLDELAPGVRGKLFYQPDKKRICVPMVFAENKGNGDVGRWLDTLSADYVIWGCTSDVLIAMLVRRGWIPVFEYISDGLVDVWVHPKNNAQE